MYPFVLQTSTSKYSVFATPRGTLETMDNDIYILVAGVFLWALVYTVHAIRFKPCELSPFELKRRTEQGDGEAMLLSERERLLPRLQTSRRIIEALLQVLAVAITIIFFGWLLGTLIAAVLSLLVGTVTRMMFFTDMAQKLYSPRENQLLDVVREWKWLDWFRENVSGTEKSAVTSKEELGYVIEGAAAVLSADELRRLRASLALDQRAVQDVMTPVSVLSTADVHDSLGPLVLDDLHKTGHSRFPVIDSDVHHVVGILYLHDVVNLRSTKPSVKDAMDSRVHYIHESQSLERALQGFLRTHRHLFIVVNDYRKTVGVLTLEDVIEALLGKKIVDEFDQYDNLRAVAESNPRKNNLPKGKTDI